MKNLEVHAALGKSDHAVLTLDFQCSWTQDNTDTLKEHEFIRLHISKYTMVVIHTEQCNTGDPLETSGGLYRGPPSMLIYINTIKCCACETLDLVQISITMKVKLLQ